jgi:YD repeat-containing protein
VESYAYDAIGNLTGKTDRKNQTYDSFGNIIATSDSIVNNFRYTRRDMILVQ